MRDGHCTKSDSSGGTIPCVGTPDAGLSVAESIARSLAAEACHEKGNHSRMPCLRRHAPACCPCGRRLAQGTGSRSGDGHREAWRTHGPGERQDGGQESLLFQALGREGLEGSSGSRELSSRFAEKSGRPDQTGPASPRKATSAGIPRTLFPFSCWAFSCWEIALRAV